VAARADTGGVRAYVYLFGSPYENPFTKSGKPKAELSSSLRLSRALVNTLSRPVPDGHPLHPANLTGEEQGGISLDFYRERESYGLGVYGAMNVYMVFGQRHNRRPNYELYTDQCLSEWRRQLGQLRKDLPRVPRDLRIELLSYDRLIKNKLS